jgi:hypothetical protein
MSQVSRILAEGSRRGEIPLGIDLNLAMDLLFGPLMHRRFSGNPAPPEFAEHVVDSFLRGLGSPSGHATSVASFGHKPRVTR